MDCQAPTVCAKHVWRVLGRLLRAESAACSSSYELRVCARCGQDEARAALYNSACARARLRQWQEAADDVVRAVNEFGLKFEVAAKVRISCGIRKLFVPIVLKSEHV